jgi:hypothetical protein
MRPSFIQAIALALLSIPFTLAFDDLSFPLTVAADTDVKLQITNDLSSGSSSFDAMFDSFRVYLSISAPGWGSGPSCYLVNSSKIATTDLAFQIPASVGPDASSYSIVTMEFNQDPYGDGPSGFEYSNDFTFTGGRGVWTASEIAGQIVGDADNVPCSAFDCARNCSQTYFPANFNNTDAYKSTYECTAACPGVTYMSWDDLEAIEGDGDDNDGDGKSPSGSVSEVGTQSTTSGTAASTLKATTTGGATGSAATASATEKSTSASTSTTSISSATTPSQSTSAGRKTLAGGFTLLSTILLGAFVAHSC